MQRTEFGSNLNTGQATHAGMTGKHNEDFFGLFAWKVDDQRDIYLGVVADGVGGQTAGEVASHLTVNTIQKYFDEQESIDDVNHHLERAILIANRAVYQATQENSEYQGMSTTVALGALLDGRLYTAHVGDSRLYLLRDGELQQLSVDHTWAQEAIEAGLLTPQEAKVHPNRNVIRRHLGGGSNIEVDHRMALPTDGEVEASEANQGTPLKPGDTLLICSDGLSDMISDEAILETLRGQFQDLPAASQELVDKANQAGGKDNITVVLMQVPGSGAPAAAVPPPLRRLRPERRRSVNHQGQHRLQPRPRRPPNLGWARRPGFSLVRSDYCFSSSLPLVCFSSSAILCEANRRQRPLPPRRL
jgi:serine/threonine protein phosphatase PrpC